MKFWVETREGDFEILERSDSSQLPEGVIRFGRADRYCSYLSRRQRFTGRKNR